MLIISHRDVNHTDTGTLPTNNMKTAEKFICAKKIAKLRPHQMTGASQRASRAVARERQNSINNLPCIFDFFFFWMISSVWDIACYKIMLFFTTKTLFLSVICSITDTNNNSPQEMRRKQINNDPNYNVVVSLD